ncbi:MAG: DUF11 domain-containing protein [Planctomycetes bacterium]|nr:DUF11 domain-containing protein [Planctomycetota bacterium]
MSMMRLIAVRVACVGALLCAVAPVRAGSHFASYQFQVDSFEIIGNLPGNAVDEFDDGVVAPWHIEEPTVIESGGFLTLMTPGELFDPLEIGGIAIESERASVRTADWTSFDVVDGQGDFTVTARWASAAAGLNQFYGVGLSTDWASGEEDIDFNMINLEPAMAEAVGVPPGLAIWFTFNDGPGPASMVVQSVSISESEVTGDVFFRLSFNDDTNEITAEFSLDNGATFRDEFAPFVWSLDLVEDMDWYLEAEEIRIVPDLAVTKTVSNDLPEEGEEIVYTITVTNDDPVDATGVTVTDQLPAGVTFVQVDSIDQGTYDDVTGLWDVGTLSSETTAQLALRATVGAGTAGTTGTGAFMGVFASGGGLGGPVGVTFGPDGDLFVASQIGDEVLRYDGATGAFAGVFTSGGGLLDPEGLKFGPDGNLYVASNDTGEILRYDGVTGTFIDVFATDELADPVSLTFGPDGGDLYVTNNEYGNVLRFERTTGAFVGIFATLDVPDDPLDLVFGPDGHLYVSSKISDAVLRFDGGTGNPIGVFAGGLDGASGIAFGPDGNLFAGSFDGDVVLRYDGQTGDFIDTFATGGGLDEPRGFAFGPDGNLYLASTSVLASEILRYQGFVTNFATASAAEPDPDILNNEAFAGITVVAADLAVTKTVSNDLPFEGDEIVYTVTVSNEGLFDATGVTVTDQLPASVTFVGVDSIDQGTYDDVTGLWDVGTLAIGTAVQLALRVTVDVGTAGTTGTGAFIDVFASGGGLNVPALMTFGPDGNLYVASTLSDEILRYDGTTGAFIDDFVSSQSGGLDDPANPRFGPDGNLYVSSGSTHEVLRYDGTTGAFIDDFVTAQSGGLGDPIGMAFGPEGDSLYVVSNDSSEVLRYDAVTGVFMDVFTTIGAPDDPADIVFGPDGHVYVSTDSGSVLRYDGATGAPLGVFASGGGLSAARALEFGPDGNLYVASAGSDAVLRYDGATGSFIDEFASGGGLNQPVGIAFGPDGNLYAASELTHQVLRYQGFITNVATASATEPDPDIRNDTASVGITPLLASPFEPPDEDPADSEPLIHAVGNFDTVMGTLDVAVLLPDPDPMLPGAVQIFLNLGNDMGGDWLGLDPQLPTIPVGADPSDIAVGDFNNDGYLDLAVTNAGDGTVSILYNDADDTGGFTPGPVIEGFTSPSAIVAADFLGIGAIDLAVADETTAQVTILENDPPGTFTSAATIDVGAGPVSMDVRDLDDNEDLDDLVVSSVGSDTVTVIINEGAGVFTAQPGLPVGLDPVDVDTDDLNLDGLDDIVTANFGDGTVTILLNLGPPDLGAPTFAEPITLDAGIAPLSVELVDLDGDSDLDIVVAGEDPIAGPALLLLENLLVPSGVLTFGDPQAIPIGAEPQHVLSGDFNDDGPPDLVTVNVDLDQPTGGSVTVLINTVFPCPGDLNGDGEVNFGDILFIIGHWGPCQIGITCPGDPNLDGEVNFGDILIVIAHWGPCP